MKTLPILVLCTTALSAAETHHVFVFMDAALRSKQAWGKPAQLR